MESLEIFKKRLAAYLAESKSMVSSSPYQERAEGSKDHNKQLQAKDGDPVRLDCIYDEEEMGVEHGYEKIPRFEAQDQLEEVNLGTAEVRRPTFISIKVDPEIKPHLIEILKQYKDCFAWEYEEMPGLDRTLVEHRLPTLPEKKPVKQPPRRFAPEVVSKIKEEIERLLRAKFIRTTRYVKWLSNIVPVIKKNGKLRVCIDFRNLNEATPKDEYPMPIADMLIDSAAGNEMLSLLDGYSGYNQIFIAEEDISKTAFRCPGALGTFEWVMMPFGLKNAGATYQRAMNLIFHDFIGEFMQVYIDDVVVKSKTKTQHLEHLKCSFERMRRHGLKMNPLKCAFGVSAGNFLGFLVQQQGIEVDSNKARAIINTKPPTNKKQLQSLLGKVNYLRRFISNLSGKTRIFSPLIKLKAGEEFKWKEEHQVAFDSIKEYLAKPPVMSPPIRGKPLRLYISASEETLGSMLAQEDDSGFERVIYYLSRSLSDVEKRYSPVEKLCLCLYFSCTKLKYYLKPVEVFVSSHFDVIKYMLIKPILHGRIGKWALALTEFSLKYVPLRAVKGQALADFLAELPTAEINEVNFVEIKHWKLFFDGSKHVNGSGIGMLIISPKEMITKVMFKIEGNCSNNEVEYEALIAGLELLLNFEASHIHVLGDSQLVINQLKGVYKCSSTKLAKYFARAKILLNQFEEVILEHVPRIQNEVANELAQVASGYKFEPKLFEEFVKANTLLTKEEKIVGNLDMLTPTDWRKPLVDYLKNPAAPVERKTKLKALNYTILAGELYKKSSGGHLLRCLGEAEAYLALAEVHEGICGAHQAGEKMKWTLLRYCYFWPSMQKDCHDFAKGCEDCQKHGNLHHTPAAELHSIVKPWPFRGWALDLIGMIHPPSSKGHKFILVGVDYFTKWVEAIPLKDVGQKEVIDFIEEHIIHRFGIPETITTDQGTMFTGRKVAQYAESRKIKLLTSTPYYAQANGQVEATNKILIGLIKKHIGHKPRNWHETLSQILWAYRNSPREATMTSPYKLVYGHEAVLPLEINLESLRIQRQNELPVQDYLNLMFDKLDILDEERLVALENIVRQKERVARFYNRRVNHKSFLEGDWVWKVQLPLGKKIPRFGKWTPNWEGPFEVEKALSSNAYTIRDVTSGCVIRAINGKHLKKYKPVMHEVKISSE